MNSTFPTNSTTTTDLEERAVGGLLLFVAACFGCLVALVIILFRPYKGSKGCGKSLHFCSISCQYVFLKVYRLFCCRCCRKGQSFIMKRASRLQQAMEEDVASNWDMMGQEEEQSSEDDDGL